MTDMPASPASRQSTPVGIVTLAGTVITAGAIATAAFDIYGQSISPWLGHARLAPVPLANQVIGVVFGEGFMPGAHLLHYLAGLIAYPLGWLLVAEPLRRRLSPHLPWIAGAVAYGVGLWIFALYIMAHLIAGNPPFLGFSGLTWVALVGHVIFAVVAALVFRLRGVGRG